MASKAKTIGSIDSTQPGTELEERERLLHSTGEQEIRVRAYEIYLQRGPQPGHELEDWLQPERELAAIPSNSPRDQSRLIDDLLLGTAAAKPKQIDRKNLDGPEKGFISVGIYEVDGATHRICHTWKGQTKRPETFEDRRRVGIGTPSVEAREEVTVKADLVGTPNHRLLSGVVHV